MNKITIKNTFETNKLIIGFDFHDGQIPFAPFELTTSGDIELNPLVIKLVEFLEMKREIEYDFEGIDKLDDETNSKLKLIKITLEEIYDGFNRYVQAEANVDEIPEDIDDFDF